MNFLKEFRNRFTPILQEFASAEQLPSLLSMVRPAQDARFGDYQANFAMPLAKAAGKAPRDLAAEILDKAELDDLIEKAEVAGPGFINLTICNEKIHEQLMVSLADIERLGIPKTDHPRTIVIDFSSPNVAKPMHVGHIRSTVIGDSLSRILSFLGHRVITDNHLGDWGTQFGMIIYGYKHFLDEPAYHRNPIAELTRLYRTVRSLIDYQSARQQLPEARELLKKQQQRLSEMESSQAEGEPGQAKKRKKDIKSLKSKIRAQKEKIQQLNTAIAATESDDQLAALADEHPNLASAVLSETARLHGHDPENDQLWTEFMEHGLREIQRVYDRMGVRFDHVLGESFYHDQLGAVVQQLQNQGLASESEGAICVFLESYDAPMIVQKSDGAYLYATTDLATIQYRMHQWQPDAILYVVDFRQGEHFEKLFDVARAWGYSDVEFQHIRFGTVMGEDGKPFRTRSGDTVGLEPLLDEAEQRALAVVSEVDDAKPEPEFTEEQRRQIARVVGIGALKYADLSQNRTSDYTFSLDKMVELKGNTATYLQYGYARVNGIFRRGEIDPDQLRAEPAPFQLMHEVERRLALQLLRFGEALDEVAVDYRPNLLANYLFELTQTFFVFFDQCPVLKAEGDVRRSRLQLCDLMARTLEKGLSLLGIGVLPKM